MLPWKRGDQRTSSRTAARETPVRFGLGRVVNALGSPSHPRNIIPAPSAVSVVVNGCMALDLHHHCIWSGCNIAQSAGAYDNFVALGACGCALVRLVKSLL